MSPLHRRASVGWPRVLSVLAFLALIVPSARGEAQSSPRVRSMAEAGELADVRYTDSGAAAWHARAEGAEAARRRARQPLRALTIDAAPGLRLTEAAEVEHEFESALVFELGPRARRARQSWALTGDALLKRSEAERWLYVTEAQHLFALWWAAEALTQYLNAELHAVREQIAHWRDTLEVHLSALDLMDLDAEAAKLAIETSEAQLQAQAAVTALRAHLAVDAQLEFVEGQSPSARLAEHTENPWTSLIALADELPEVRALEAEARAAELRSRAQQARSIELGVGAKLRLTDGDAWLLSPTLGLEIPIAREGREDAAITAAEAVALRAEARVRAEALRAWLRGEAARHDALLRAAHSVSSDAMSQLHTRVRALERALEAGHVDLRRVFFARRDLLDAVRRGLMVHAELEASEAAAIRILQALHGATP